jgi:hypothetical protein
VADQPPIGNRHGPKPQHQNSSSTISDLFREIQSAPKILKRGSDRRLSILRSALTFAPTMEMSSHFTQTDCLRR